MEDVRARVSEFYGQTVGKTQDLLYSACCTTGYDPKLLEHLTPEVREKRYGCESPLPELLEGCTLVDLGSGAGPDCFIAARLVGPEGRVIGVDMTPALLEIARRNIAPIMHNLGYQKPNVEFREGHIEKPPVEDDSVDVVISNCVINLSPHKEQIWREIHRMLKPGGEMYISDIVADRRIGADFNPDPRLHSECLTGAAYLGDVKRQLRAAGFADVRVVLSRPLAEVIEGVGFQSVILRCFKLELEDQGEDYGQVAVYRGTIPGKEQGFTLDLGNELPAGRTVRVCKNTADILRQSRFAPHFRVSAELAHLGRFVGDHAASATTESSKDSSGCC